MDSVDQLYKVMEGRNELTPALIIAIDFSPYAYSDNPYVRQDAFKKLVDEVRSDPSFLETLRNEANSDGITFDDIANDVCDEYGFDREEWDEILTTIYHMSVLGGLCDFFNEKLVKVASSQDIVSICQDDCDIAIPDSIREYAKESYSDAIYMHIG